MTASYFLLGRERLVPANASYVSAAAGRRANTKRNQCNK
jgi:hypothetical protein